MQGASGLYTWSLLFVLYLNDLCNVSKVVGFIILADDANKFFSRKDFSYFVKS